jgi:N-acetyl-anhydromuramyl-L-alanine amidase AmpD
VINKRKVYKWIFNHQSMSKLESMTRGEFIKIATLGMGALATVGIPLDEAYSFEKAKIARPSIVDSLSPKNSKRGRKEDNKYIILHTTEGNGPGSLSRIKRYGLANFMVDYDGKIYRTISENRLAKHAGRSMWNGTRGLDDYSIGIEVVGYHDRNITSAQYSSLKSLLDWLKAKEGISDRNVLTHSMVAYGAPNRWHSRSHRGRKRCGM